MSISAHPETPEAVDAPVSSEDDALAALENYLDEENDEEESDDADQGEEPEAADEDQDDEADEPETVIDAPVSLNAEEKAVFAQLPPEAQQAWAASETRRNAQVQEATTKAAHAQRSAEASAAEAHSKAKAVFAEQLAHFASAYAPQAPDPELARHNPAEYIAQKAQYDAHKAQHDQFVQQVVALGDEAGEEMDQAFIATRARELRAIPEVANEATREAFFQRVQDVAQSLGYDEETLFKNGHAQDFKALHAAHEWREKAAKYDALMAKQMQRVRDARTAKPGAAQPRGSSTARAAEQSARRLKETGSLQDAAAALANIL